MPYKSKAERESENWMTLPQVVAHIQSSDRLDDERKARDELLKALENGAFQSHRRSLIRWKDEVRISGEPPDEIGPRDVPPQGHQWAVANIRWDIGEVLDPYGAVENGKWQPEWRIVWLARSKVMEIWQPSPKGSALVSPTDKHVWHKDTEDEYKLRLSSFSPDRFPTRDEDEKWARDKRIGRNSVRELREKYIPEAYRKGGAPKRHPDAKPGQK